MPEDKDKSWISIFYEYLNKPKTEAEEWDGWILVPDIEASRILTEEERTRIISEIERCRESK